MRKYKIFALVCWFAFLLTLLWMFSGCRAVKEVPVKETTIEKTIETVHDTVFKTEADSSAYRALLECQNGKVVVKEVRTATAGKHLNAPKVNIRNNELDVECEARAQELFAQWISKYKETQKTIEVPVFIEKPLTKWEKLQIWVGRIFLGLILLIVCGYGIIKLVSKIKLKS